MSQKWSEFQTITQLEIEKEGREENLMIDVEVEKHLIRESQYGADIDGNRGRPVTFIDEWKIITICDSDSGEDLTEELKDDPDVYSAIEKELG